MFLKSIRVRNFRSLSSDDAKPSAEVALGQGINYIAGPNNAGKSNLLRAVALALDPSYPYDGAVDRPDGYRADAQSTVTLEFEVTKAKGPIDTLVRYAEAYERSVPDFKGPSLASRGIVRFHVQVNQSARQELLLTKAGVVKGDPRKLAAAVRQFRNVVRFVDIRSGEDLDSLLARGFKEILGTVVEEGHSAKVEAAEKKRTEYAQALGEVLQPLARHVQERINRYVRDISEVDLVPSVPEVADAVAGARFLVRDAVKTGLDQKGTGVRGATLLMLLSFIADSSRRAVVFAIEEPESFLHPEAHRALGVGLEQFTRRNDVSVLVTTHSPFLFRGDPTSSAKLFTVSKDAKGRSKIANGGPDIARTELLGSPVFATLLRRAEQVSDTGKLILVVEGWTDQRYLELAAARGGASLAGIDIVPATGAVDAAFQAVALKGLYQSTRPISALFDEDEEGRRAQQLLTGKFRWQNKKEVISYKQWVAYDNVPVEAEDMFPNSVMKKFLAEVGEEGHLDGKNLRPQTKIWHFSLTEAGKLALIDWLTKHGQPSHFGQWMALLAVLHQRIEDAQKATRAPASDA